MRLIFETTNQGEEAEPDNDMADVVCQCQLSGFYPCLRKPAVCEFFGKADEQGGCPAQHFFAYRSIEQVESPQPQAEKEKAHI
ncbi:hypothetical protein [Brevibacillus sp. IT-7CA2]|uniref:hypothetical protein n=1 Tax=Brevibacillus sp. IT-7CA2 TaxID=3026436 RepID=UPI0039DFE2B3